MNNKDFFKFSYFDNLKVGDVFKFSPTLDNNIPSKFYTVYLKDETLTKINSTYGKNILRLEFINSLPREIMIFPNRKKIHIQTTHNLNQ